MTGYYKKFILNFAAIVKALFKLTKTEMKFEGTEERNETFIVLKTACVLPQSLYNQKSIVCYQKKISSTSIQILQQRNRRCIVTERKSSFPYPVWFSSKSLTKGEFNYLVTDLEAAAVTHALNNFSFFIYNAERTVVKTTINLY